MINSAHPFPLYTSFADDIHTLAVVEEHFEWDDRKSEVNKRKHGIDFYQARELWRRGVVEFPSPHGGEMRYVAFGQLHEKLTLVVVTYRGSRRRIISARHATADEQVAYERAKTRRS